MIKSVGVMPSELGQKMAKPFTYLFGINGEQSFLQP